MGRFKNGLVLPHEVVANAARAAAHDAVAARTDAHKARRLAEAGKTWAPRPDELATLQARARTSGKVARSLAEAAVRRQP